MYSAHVTEAEQSMAERNFDAAEYEAVRWVSRSDAVGDVSLHPAIRKHGPPRTSCTAVCMLWCISPVTHHRACRTQLQYGINFFLPTLCLRKPRRCPPVVVRGSLKLAINREHSIFHSQHAAGKSMERCQTPDCLSAPATRWRTLVLRKHPPAHCMLTSDVLK